MAAPDINAKTFRAQVQAIGPLKPPLLVLVSKDDGALRVSSFLDGGIARAGGINVDDPVVQEAALKEKVQIVAFRGSQSTTIWGMTSSSVLPYFIHDCTTKPRVIATRLAHSSLQMTMRRSCGRSTSEIRWLRNERPSSQLQAVFDLNGEVRTAPERNRAARSFRQLG
jgi:esterase/lipase superfamily enzyme